MSGRESDERELARPGWAMTEQEERLARERAEIAVRVARFRETQQKFERERHEYYATTLGKAWPAFWT
jgi:hypothetical protein